MNLILKWLHRNELLVHMVVMLLVFYGIPVTSCFFTHPELVASLIDSAIAGFTIVLLFYISFRAAAFVTDFIGSLAIKVELKVSDEPEPQTEKDKIVDYTSPNMLVVNAAPSESDVSATVVTSKPKPVEVVVQQEPVEKKKRAPRAKSVKKEG